MLTVDNRTSRDWRQVEIWLNTYYRLTTAAIPAGGRFQAPLDVFVVRKLGVPGREELAMGALASGGARVLNQEVISALRISHTSIQAIVAKEQRELKRREQLYRGQLPPLEVTTQTVILVDDGLATGSTMRAALAGLRQLSPRQLVVGVPVAAPETCHELSKEADDVVCAAMPQPFHSVGLWYGDFSQTTDQEVRELLEARRGRQPEQRTRSAS